ncbi:OPT oligopeptide transporter protein-domain-containing protein [Fimicolochytrium jonesii]|uniref:OPT oligopeptide transporter protein-domain-containing protein n=1 Tax=Fimicolochytrium jonesii TaxID=1396493 RepID=UPI0022FEA657|nr:OPT oligopeptide transporter protein-domain-containing protein [Fimicolochytrium jonesii]KAI8822241.1 OPT oligopeptide transporter protein-domain-containing protein [Fimicolochytrium jonesii]
MSATVPNGSPRRVGNVRPPLPDGLSIATATSPGGRGQRQYLKDTNAPIPLQPIPDSQTRRYLIESTSTHSPHSDGPLSPRDHLKFPQEAHTPSTAGARSPREHLIYHQEGHSPSTSSPRSTGEPRPPREHLTAQAANSAFRSPQEHLAATQNLRGDWDPTIPQAKRDAVLAALGKSEFEEEEAYDPALEEDSPYPEVRAAVRNYDDVDMPANTVRAWVLGFILTTLASGLNMLFSLREPSITITAIVIQLVAFPLGVIWEKLLPKNTWLNPGHFNHKEHVVITVMANAAFGGGVAYATDVILAMEQYYHIKFGWAFQLLLTITSQCIGFGMAGMCRRFLVWPAAMIWPTTLANTALFYTLHERRSMNPKQANGWGWSRYKWFMVLASLTFVWHWVPLAFFTALSNLGAFPTWIAPKNVLVNKIFGSSTGLGLIPITLDWTMISGYLTSPLTFPWHAIANTMLGVGIFYVIFATAANFSGLWYGHYMSISDSSSWDRFGEEYDVTKVLTSSFQFDIAAYKAYSPMILSTTFALGYGLSFANVACVLTNTWLFYGKEIMTRFKEARDQEDDIHMKLMKRYKDAADWWFLVLFLVTFGASLFTVMYWDTQLDWWGLSLSLLMALLWVIPVGIVQACTNMQVGLNVITEFVIGYLKPGRPVAMMLFKTYGYISMAQALYFVQDLKLGHYMKVPPKILFTSQIVATVWSSIVQVIVYNWAMQNIPGVCERKQPAGYTCPNAKTFYTASAIWGVIGPQRMFSMGEIYSSLLWFFPIGFFLPFLVYYLAKKFPRSIFRYIDVPVLFACGSFIPPATIMNYVSWGFVGWLFNKVFRDRFRGWWINYNFVTSAALDCGLALATIAVFFALTYHGTTIEWWGNTVDKETLDHNGMARTIVLTNGTFGPNTW